MRTLFFALIASFLFFPAFASIPECSKGLISLNINDPEARGQIVFLDRNDHVCQLDDEIIHISHTEIHEKVKLVLQTAGHHSVLRGNSLVLFLDLDAQKDKKLLEEISSIPGVRFILPNSKIR